MKVIRNTILRQDSLSLSITLKDTLEVDSGNVHIADEKDVRQLISDSTQKAVRIATKPVKDSAAQVPVKTVRESSSSEIIFHSDTKQVTRNIFLPEVAKQYAENSKIFHYYEQGKLHFQYAPKSIWKDISTSLAPEGEMKFDPYIYLRSQLNWTLFVGLFSIVLLLGLKSYYRKFVNQVINTLVNFQLADKLLREKNILVRRAFFMLNINFLLIFSLFIMLLMDMLGVSFTERHIINYFFILGIIGGILLIRLILYYLVAYIFEWMPAINQQIHSSYLINKNIGLILLPIVFAAIYTSPGVSEILIFIGAGLFLIASVYKLIRGFQIILRNGILLFYAFLYLCTLELLPWVLSSKFIIYLR